MDKRFLPPPATFADGSYPAGSDAWSSQPRVIPLSAATKSAGFTPNTPNGARAMNQLLREYHDVAGIYAHDAMQRWTPKMILPTDNSYVVTAATPLKITDKQQYYFLSVGVNFLDIHTSLIPWPREQAEHLTNAVGVTPAQIVGTKNGVYQLRLTGSDHYYFGDVGHATLSDGMFFAGGGQTVDLLGFVGTATTGAALFALSNGLLYYNSSGAITVAASQPSVPGAFAPYEFQQNPDGSICVFSCKNGTTPQLWYSTDFGVNWTLGHTFAANTAPSALCFWEAQGVFLYLEDSTGNIYSSSDGAVWTIAEGGAPQSVTNGGALDKDALQQITGGFHTMAACGPCVARLIRREDAGIGGGTTRTSQGVAYTFDLVNWNYTPLINGTGATAGFGNLREIYNLDGRFVVVAIGSGVAAGDSAGHTSLIVSGALEAPGTDFP